MARRKVEIGSPQPDMPLVNRLYEELIANRDSGQPSIYEHELGQGRLRVLVIWDEWKDILLEARTAIIHRAYEKAESTDFQNKIALASGLTFPEATAAGMLPYQIGTALRKDDPVTFQQCWDAMAAEGASKIFGPGILQLRFATEVEAEACRKRLIDRLPGSDNVWMILREVATQDPIMFQEAADVAS